MCGIVGIYNTLNLDSATGYAKSMADAIAYRGPDAHGVKLMGATAFAHRRLAIIDLDHAADQPFCNVSGDCMIVFNGEIYNYLQIRKYLQGKGVDFRTRSDTEVILALYEYGGAEALSQLDGMFAFAIYDHRQQTLLLMRDRLGKKPLYFHTVGKAVHFASTLPALKRHSAWQEELSTEAIKDFLALGYIPGNGSVYQSVQQLPPATIMTFSPDGSSYSRKYWQLDYSKKSNMSMLESCEMLREKFSAAVAKRLISDVPCGLFLSGGIDSALVAMQANCCSNEDLSAFTIGFNEAKYDERDLAAATVGWINKSCKKPLQHFTAEVDCRSFDTLKELTVIYGEPFADFSLLPTYFLSKFTAGKVKVALSGDGADEIFGGYERYRAMRIAHKLDHLLPRFAMRMLSATANTLFKDHGKRSKLSRFSRFLRLAATPEGERYAMLMLQGTTQLRQALYGERLNDHTASDPARYINKALKHATTCEKTEQYAECDLHTYLAGDILVKVDRAAMANSLEVRSPFLDTQLVEFASSLPFEFKQKQAQRKIILKKALGDLLAPEVKSARKRGFAVPIGHWLRNEWRTLAAEHLLEGELVKGSWLKADSISKLLAEHNSCRRDHSELIGNMLMLELFLENSALNQ